MTKSERQFSSTVMKLANYPEYKDSGIPWLGKVPTHWRVMPNRGTFIEVNEQNHPDDEMLSVTISQGVIKQSILLEDSSTKDGSRIDRSYYKLVEAGDIAYNKMRAWQGAIGVSDYRGIISPAYVVQRPRQGNNPNFLHYLLRTPAFAREAERNSYGITSDMWSLRPEHFKIIYSCIPPLEEQDSIARFLDHADEQIQRYIAGKKRLIALLEEERQAVIHQAVTRGLDPNVKLKPSGVEWLGDVPEHWEIGPLKRFAARYSGAIKAGPFGSQLTSADMTGTDFKVYTQRNVIDRDLEKGFTYISNAKFHDLRAFEIVPGDVLVTSRGTIGRTALVANSCERGVLHPCLLRIHPDHERLVPEFLMTLIQDSQLLPQQLMFLSNSTTIDVIYSSTLANTVVPVPPLTEQVACVEHLDRVTSDIDTAINSAHRQIDLMNEYRTRLIADVVTGQLDVREAAEELPTPEPTEITD